MWWHRRAKKQRPDVVDKRKGGDEMSSVSIKAMRRRREGGKLGMGTGEERRGEVIYLGRGVF